MLRFLPILLTLSACGTLPLTATDTHTEPTPTAPTVEDGALTEVSLTPPVVEPETAPPETVPVEAPVPVYATYELRRGETLAHFARWSDLPVEVIAESSGLDLEGGYPVGTTIRVPVESPEMEARIADRREAHREARVEGYVASRGGAIGTSFVAVRTGDTATSIARENQDVPVWLIEAYNPEVDLDHLRPGQELMVPVLADIVVDAEDLPIE